MITINDITINDIVGDSYGEINIPVKLFGKIRFDSDDNSLGIMIKEGVNLETTIDSFNEYIHRLGDCKDLLEKFYSVKNKYLIDEYYEGKMKDDWYNTLEMYSASVEVYGNGAFGAYFACGDNMDYGHILDIEIEGFEIRDMRFDG